MSRGQRGDQGRQSGSFDHIRRFPSAPLRVAFACCHHRLLACALTMKVAFGMPLFPRSTSRPPVGALVVVEAETAVVLDMAGEAGSGCVGRASGVGEAKHNFLDNYTTLRHNNLCISYSATNHVNYLSAPRHKSADRSESRPIARRFHGSSYAAPACFSHQS